MTEQNIGEVEVMTGDPIEDAFKKYQPDVAETEEVQEPVEVIDEVEDEADQEDGDSEAEQPFPKKAVNAISRHKKNANKFKAERDAYAREIEALKKQVEAAKSVERPSEPTLDKFDTVSEYLKAQARYETQNALSDHENQRAESRLKDLETQQRENYEEERSEYIAQQAQELFTTVPDAKEVFAAVMPIVENLPPEIANIAQELDNAPLAIYNLYREGKLERLAYMPPHLAAVALYQAQMTPPKVAPKVSQAPKPISAAKGGGASKTSLNSMSPDKLVEWVNS